MRWESATAYSRGDRSEEVMNETRERETIDVEDLYRRYGPMVLRRCRGMLRDEDLAADAMQETFVQVLRHRSSLNARYPSSLLYPHCHEYLPERHAKPAGASSPSAPSPS